MANYVRVLGSRTIKAVTLVVIGIEPMNKGFAVRPGPLSPSVMERHRPVFIDLLREPGYSVILKIAPDPPQKSPQWISSDRYAAFDVGTRLMRSYSARRAWCVPFFQRIEDVLINITSMKMSPPCGNPKVAPRFLCGKYF